MMPRPPGNVLLLSVATRALFGPFLFRQPKLVDTILEHEEAAKPLPPDIAVVLLKDDAHFFGRFRVIKFGVDSL
jgi:hypothetical protein